LQSNYQSNRKKAKTAYAKIAIQDHELNLLTDASMFNLKKQLIFQKSKKLQKLPLSSQ
jgi:hypothetical protein